MIIKTFKNNGYIEFGFGNFDKWCVFIKNPIGTKKPPLDREYFKQIKYFFKKYGKQIYDDYIQIYNQTTKEINKKLLKEITKISKKYSNDEIEIDMLLTTLYLTMIAEENKENAIIGKRIKRLGIYLILFEEKPIEYVTEFMKGMNFKEIDKLCKERGF